MLFANLHFSLIIQRSCMMENKCSGEMFRFSRLISIAFV